VDPILFWNDVALEANRVSHTNGKNEQTGPTLSSRALAIVHLAMYDAYAGVINDASKLPRYIAAPPSPSAGPSPATENAAVAAAAHTTLSSLFPSQKPFFDSILNGVGDKSNPGHKFGEDVGKEILADRAGDPGAGGDYKPKPQRCRHRPDPDNPGQGFHAPFYGAKSKGFAITARHTLQAPPCDDKEYEDALREVRYKGIVPELMGTLPNNSGKNEPRTVDETLIGIFWGYDGASGLGTPPRLYNQIVREVAINKPNPDTGKPNTPAQNARLFAFVHVAMADAGILAWEEKYRHDLWRPVVGIREHDKSMGPAATQAENNVSDDCDSSWLPLGAPNTNRIGAKNGTPNFPAYPSGHATFGAAAFHITRLFYKDVSKERRDDLFDGLDFVSDEFNGINTDNKGAVRPRHVRNFRRGLWQMIEENGFSRVYLGVHWVFDAFAVTDDGDPDLDRNVGGVPLGLEIAKDIFQAGGGKAPKKSTVGPRP
jgi:Vanadium chloroperoxidase N-terminal domain/PAP2 superfamily